MFAVELARELLELFVGGGPEGDLIVEAYVPPSQASQARSGRPKDTNTTPGDRRHSRDDEAGSETQPLSDEAMDED